MSTAVIRAFISRNPSRKSFFIYAVLLFLTEVLIALYAPAGFIRGFGGGAVRDNEQMNQFLAQQTALGRVGLPDDIGGAISVLLSPAAACIVTS